LVILIFSKNNLRTAQDEDQKGYIYSFNPCSPIPCSPGPGTQKTAAVNNSFKSFVLIEKNF
jgi:hypothetical protein